MKLTSAATPKGDRIRATLCVSFLILFAVFMVGVSILAPPEEADVPTVGSSVPSNVTAAATPHGCEPATPEQLAAITAGLDPGLSLQQAFRIPAYPDDETDTTWLVAAAVLGLEQKPGGVWWVDGGVNDPVGSVFAVDFVAMEVSDWGDAVRSGSPMSEILLHLQRSASQRGIYGCR